MLMYVVILEINCNNRVFLGHDGISSLKILLFGNGWKEKKKKKQFVNTLILNWRNLKDFIGQPSELNFVSCQLYSRKFIRIIEIEIYRKMKKKRD